MFDATLFHVLHPRFGADTHSTTDVDLKVENKATEF